MTDAMQRTQTNVLRWAVDSFGNVAANRDERAARLAEESVEVAQAEGVPKDVILRIVERLYKRPSGELWQEIGGTAITLQALAENVGLDLEECADREWRRVLSKPRSWWKEKHAAKVAAGTADLSALPEEETSVTDIESNGFWVIVEIMGHKRFAGHVTEQVVGGASFVRVDVPANGECTAFSKLFGVQTARGESRGFLGNRRDAIDRGRQPMSEWDLPQEWRQAVSQGPRFRSPRLHYESEDDAGDTDL